MSADKSKHSQSYEYSVFEYREFIRELEDKLDNSEQVIGKLQEQVKGLTKLNEVDRTELINRFVKLQAIAITGIEAAALIINAICEANTSHWQKKENLRNALGVLAILQKRIAKADPTPLPFDDDF
jgi:hypothetical protein